MASTTRIIGGAGTGKTHRLMEIVASLCRQGLDPVEIGFSSFTRTAREEAATRAAEYFRMDPQILARDGWFKTLHSVCYHMLDVRANQIINDKPESLRWLQDVFGEAIEPARFDPDTGMPMVGSEDNITGLLNWWSMCRSRLLPVQEVIHLAPLARNTTVEQLIAKIEHYERRKLIDDKLDFADMPLRVAGLRHRVWSIDRVTPEGCPPPVRAWILDEYQDTFPAIHAAARRIASYKTVEHVYVSGDSFQSIYGFLGGDPKFLMSGWDYTAEETLQQGRRCPRLVSELSERVIQQCSDYYDRQIRPRDGDQGVISSVLLHPEGPAHKIEGKWMFLARTNGQAMRLGKWLSRSGVPWVSTTGKEAYLHPSTRQVAKAILDLRSGKSISNYEWAKLIRSMEPTVGTRQLVRDGFMMQLETYGPESLPERIRLADTTQYGVTDHFIRVLQSDHWDSIYRSRTSLHLFAKAIDRYGLDQAMNPQLLVGTIHSVKGGEADNIMLYDPLTKRCRDNLNLCDQSLNNEEYRVWYVGVTRAKKTLVTARFATDKYAMLRFV